MSARSRYRNPELLTGLLIVGGLVLIAILFSWTGIGDPYSSGDETTSGPSPAHPLGTDNLGRDSMSRLAVAAGTTIGISAAATAIALAAGTALGLLAGYGPRAADATIMRVCDVLLAIPAILVALMTRVIFGPGTLPLILAMALIYAPVFARVMRAPTLVLRQRDFVVAAEMTGRSKVTIALRHILPNAITPVLVQAAATASEIVLLEAALSYLGQGVQPPDPSAGRMISEFQKFLQTDPLLVLFPAMLIVLISAGWNLIADGLQAHASRNRALDIPQRRRGLIALVPQRAAVLRDARETREREKTGGRS